MVFKAPITLMAVLVLLGLSYAHAEVADPNSNLPQEAPIPIPRPEGLGNAQQQTNSGTYSGPSLSLRDYDTEDQIPKACDQFIDARGNFGVWGERLVQAMRDVGIDCFHERTDFSFLCPKFNTFDPQMKNRFLVFLFGSIAGFETSCRPNVDVQGSNDIASGLFQLEYSRAQRAAAGRHPRFCATDRAVDSQSIDFQMECSAAIFAKSYCGTGRQVGNVRHGYWQKLKTTSRGGIREITELAQRFPHCK